MRRDHAPLRIGRLFQGPEPDRALLPVVVLRGDGGGMGLVVDQIEDIVQAEVALDGEQRGELLSGTAVIQGRVADVLDPAKLLARAGAGPAAAGTARRV